MKKQRRNRKKANLLEGVVEEALEQPPVGRLGEGDDAVALHLRRDDCEGRESTANRESTLSLSHTLSLTLTSEKPHVSKMRLISAKCSWEYRITFLYS